MNNIFIKPHENSGPEEMKIYVVQSFSYLQGCKTKIMFMVPKITMFCHIQWFTCLCGGLLIVLI